MTESELSKYLDEQPSLWPINTVIRRRLLHNEYKSLTLQDFKKIIEKTHPSSDDGITLQDILKLYKL